MSTFNDLVAKLREASPELTEERVQQLVREKKDKIGAGYLTDEGAIFLIASDMGISLDDATSSVATKIKDLYIGAKEVSLQTRILSLPPSKQYSRKDGSPFHLRTMTVYDGDSTASVKLWDEKANLPGIEDLKPGDLIKIIKAYVKSDLNGTPTINIGSGSTIEPTTGEDGQGTQIPTIESITKDPAEIKDGDSNIVVSGKLDGMMSTMRFTNSRGQPSTALKFSLRGRDGNSIRVVLWGKDEASVPKIISTDATVKLFGVKARPGMQQDLEIHGNDSTNISIEDQQEFKSIIARIISVTEDESGDRLIVAADRDRSLIRIVDSSKSSSQFAEGDVIECMPSRAYGSSVWLDKDSFVRRLDDGGGSGSGLPTREEMRTKISEITADKSICIDAIILKKIDRRDISTKRGDTVSLSEMLVEDDSGQIWVKGWRDQARLVDKCSIGEVVTVTGLNSRPGLEGRLELTLSAFSKITPRA